MARRGGGRGRRPRRGPGALALALLLAVAAAPPPASAEAAPDPRWASSDVLDDFLARERARLRLPSLAVVVLRDGAVAYQSFAGDGGNGPVTADTAFELGSTTKQLTGLLVQRLVADGLLTLDEPVLRVLPELAAGDPRWQQVTVRNLVTHRSGLGPDAVLYEQTAWPSTRTLADEAARIVHDEPLVNDPGTAFVYTDAGYVVLGAAIERVTGRSYEQALRELVTGPLGLSRTTTDLARAEADGLAPETYTWFGLVNAGTGFPKPAARLPGGGAASTAGDLTALLRAHLGGAGVQETLLAAARRPLADGDGTFRYASGWVVRPLWELTDANAGYADPALPTYWEHSGQTPRSLSYLGFAPDLGLGVLALTNTGTGTDADRWDVFTDALVHQVVGTRAGPLPPGLRLLDPLVALGLTLALLVATAWLARARRRWPPAVVGGVLATLVVLAAWAQDMTHTSWWVFYPDLAAALGLGLLTAVAFLVVVVVRSVRAERARWHLEPRRSRSREAAP